MASIGSINSIEKLTETNYESWNAQRVNLQRFMELHVREDKEDARESSRMGNQGWQSLGVDLIVCIKKSIEPHKESRIVR